MKGGNNLMLIKYSDLSMPFGRLALGTMLIDTFGNRYMKMLGEECEYFWLNQFDLLHNSGLSDTQMSEMVEEDWLVLV